MGLRSPFGNGPSDLSQPVPGAQTMAQMYSQMPSQIPVNRAPAAAPSPPQPAPGGMSDQEAKDLQGISPQELADLRELQNNNRSIGDKVIDHVKKHWGEMAGATVGGMAGAAATGGLGGELPGAAFGGAIGEKIQRYVDGQPQPTLGESFATGLENAAGVGTVGALARIGGGATSGFLKDSAKAAAESVLGSEAAQAAKGRIADADSLGVPALSYQTGEGTTLGAKAAAEGQRVAVGDRGVIPQQQLVNIQAEQEAGIQARLKQIKEMFAPQKGRAPQEGEKMGHLNQDLQPHEFAQNWLDRYHGMIDYVKGRAQEIFKDRQFDATQLMQSVESALKKNNIIDDAGAPTARVADLDPNEKQLYNTWKSLGRATSRKSGMSGASSPTGGGIPGMVDSGNGPFMATGTTSSLPPGSPSAMPEINMARQPDMVPGQPPTKISLLPPNEAGPAQAGISFNLLDNIVSKIQKIAATGRESMNKSYLQPSWDDLSKDATTAFHDVIREHLAPADPESANLLARVDKLYSGYADSVKDMAYRVRQNPSAAANVFVDKANPAATRQSFHILNQAEGDVVRRQILAQEFEKAMTNGNGKASAQTMLDGLKAYGNDNLDVIFPGQRGDVMNALGAMAHLQNTQISPAARAANLMRLEDAASKSGVIRQGLDLFNAMLNNNKDLQKYIGSPDFQAKILRKSQLFNYQSGATRGAVQAARDATGTAVGTTLEKIDPLR